MTTKFCNNYIFVEQPVSRHNSKCFHDLAVISPERDLVDGRPLRNEYAYNMRKVGALCGPDAALWTDPLPPSVQNAAL